jgi:hypothetical protein
MTVARFIFLLALFGSLGIAVVILRADQVRRSHHIQTLQLQQVGLQRVLWARQMEVARLREPRSVRERARRFDVPIVPPHDGVDIASRQEPWTADP